MLKLFKIIFLLPLLLMGAVEQATTVPYTVEQGDTSYRWVVSPELELLPGAEPDIDIDLVHLSPLECSILSTLKQKGSGTIEFKHTKHPYYMVKIIIKVGKDPIFQGYIFVNQKWERLANYNDADRIGRMQKITDDYFFEFNPRKEVALLVLAAISDCDPTDLSEIITNVHDGLELIPRPGRREEGPLLSTEHAQMSGAEEAISNFSNIVLGYNLLMGDLRNDCRMAQTSMQTEEDPAFAAELNDYEERVTEEIEGFLRDPQLG